MRTTFLRSLQITLFAALLLATGAVQAMNNDGKPDILWRNSSTGANEVCVTSPVKQGRNF